MSWVFFIFSLVFTVFLAAAIKVVIPSIRPYRHSAKEVCDALKKFENAEINSNSTGLLAQYTRLVEFNDSAPNATSVKINGHIYGVIPHNFKIKRRVLVVGRGMDDFKKACRIMNSFKATNQLGWVKVISLPISEGGSGIGISKSDSRKLSDNEDVDVDVVLPVGSTVAVLANVYNTFFWTVNPARIISSHDKPSIDPETMEMYSDVTYSTIAGHLMEGDERFRVSMLPSSFRASSSHSQHMQQPRSEQEALQAGDVLFEVISYARGCGLVGQLAFPLIEPLQEKFLRDTTNSMKRLMSQ